MVEIFDAVNSTLFSVQLRMLHNKWLLGVAIVLFSSTGEIRGEEESSTDIKSQRFRGDICRLMYSVLKH